jgi:hypothetical protein
MADISIQFYATTEEFADWITAWVDESEIAVAAIAYQPFSVEAAGPCEIRSFLFDTAVRRICMFPAGIPPNLHARSMSEFHDRNEGMLVLDIGRLSEAGLCESCLACRTADSVTLAKWRRIASDLKKRTKSGVTGINRRNGVAVFYRSCRFSNGAAELEAAGTPMVPTQGPNGPIIKLGNIAGA